MGGDVTTVVPLSALARTERQAFRACGMINGVLRPRTQLHALSSPASTSFSRRVANTWVTILRQCSGLFYFVKEKHPIPACW